MDKNVPLFVFIEYSVLANNVQIRNKSDNSVSRRHSNVKLLHL